MSSSRREASRRLFADPEFRARHKQATREARAFKWTEEIDAKLISLFLGGARWREIRQEMRLSITVCLRRLRDLGVYQRRRPGPRQGAKRAGNSPPSPGL